ncbi:vacuolar protein sorting-associated protein 32 homolog 2 [Tanacetum coccineum]
MVRSCHWSTRLRKIIDPKGLSSAEVGQDCQTLDMLEKKEKVLLKKADAEVERAREFTKAKNKKGAIQCLKRKKLYERQIEQLGNFQLRIHDQMIMLEGAKATTETVDALRTGADAMKAYNKHMNINDVDKTMDELNEQSESMKQIWDTIQTYTFADFDEDELEAELEELEGAELEDQILPPTITTGTQHAHPPPQKNTAEVDEISKMQAELAL